LTLDCTSNEHGKRPDELLGESFSAGSKEPSPAPDGKIRALIITNPPPPARPRADAPKKPAPPARSEWRHLAVVLLAGSVLLAWFYLRALAQGAGQP